MNIISGCLHNCEPRKWMCILTLSNYSFAADRRHLRMLEFQARRARQTRSGHFSPRAHEHGASPVGGTRATAVVLPSLWLGSPAPPSAPPPTVGAWSQAGDPPLPERVRVDPRGGVGGRAARPATAAGVPYAHPCTTHYSTPAAGVMPYPTPPPPLPSLTVVLGRVDLRPPPPGSPSLTCPGSGRSHQIFFGTVVACPLQRSTRVCRG